VSRSGITLTTARFLKISREEASRFSFLMSLPIIFASIVYKSPEIIRGEATYVSLTDTLLGVSISFVVGLLTIHFFLKFIKRIGLFPFAVYRVLLGIVLLLLY
jgi:undecaprenyl-diphosphatase